jgi:hypothetical protein
MGVAPWAASAAPATSTDDLQLSEGTSVGVHNAYDKANFPYFADALDSGASLLELDVWVISKKWRVAHDLPLIASNNNCNAGKGRTGAQNQDLAGCLDDIRAWQSEHADHPFRVFKVEMKNGFDGRSGMGAKELDRLIADKLGAAVFRPADLLGGAYPDLDTAAKANAWPTRGELRGKIMFELIPGTFEQKNPFDHYWTDAEYADSLRTRAAAGTIGQAMIFPAVLNAAAGDPRTRYGDLGRRPWFVVFDGDAVHYVDGSIAPKWYDDNHYFLIMTSADAVPPVIDSQNPTTEQARARIAQLASAHASLVTADWRTTTGVLADVLPRG